MKTITNSVFLGPIRSCNAVNIIIETANFYEARAIDAIKMSRSDLKSIKRQP